MSTERSHVPTLFGSTTQIASCPYHPSHARPLRRPPSRYSVTQLLLVLANSKVLGLARAKRNALPVLLKEWRSMIGSPQDCKSCIDFCVAFSDQDNTLLFGFAQSWLIQLVRVQAPSPTAGWNRTRGNPQCWRRSASCHRSSTSKSVTGTQSLSRSTMLRPGKTKQRAARTKVPAHVWWTKRRPLASLMGKKTTSQSSLAGPCMQARLDHQAATAGQCCNEGSGLSRLVRSRLSTRTYTVDRNRKWLILAKIKPNKRFQSGLPIPILSGFI